MSVIVTIAREYGSGGHEIGKRLAIRLNIRFFDKEIIALTADRTVYDENFILENEEQTPNFFIDAGMGGRISPVYCQSVTDNVFFEQAKTIRAIAAKGDCVIVGRCADYILRDVECLKIFVHAPFACRVRRKLQLLPESTQMTQNDMEKEVKCVDKKREKFYEYYTDNKWGDCANYHLSIDVEKVGIDGAVDTIITYLEKYNHGSMKPD
ncbi:MAG: cytidylate kinase-like family protein [Clostridia bacterium]|nr:cytidylate kinase-like family protein [Clostridia bacterium]